MSRDAVMLERASRPAIRFYGWSEPSISLGKHQQVSRAVHAARCCELGVRIVRRPTGGKAVLHGHDLTFSVALPLSLLPRDRTSVGASHCLIMGAVATALKQLGVTVRHGFDVPSVPSLSPADCFLHVSEADLAYEDGTKAAGGAQARSRSGLLQQVSIPLGSPRVPPNEVFVGPTAPIGNRLSGLDIEELQRCIAVHLARAIGGEMVEDAWSDDEEAAARERAAMFAVDTTAAL